MATLPYMQFYVADYLADTSHLSTIEHGAYMLLIFNYWQRGESFKAKDERSLNKRLMSVTKLSEHDWNDIKETLADFFDASETEWRHNRIDSDLEKVNIKLGNASKAGKASAEARYKKTIEQLTTAQQTFNECLTDVQQTFNHKDKIRIDKIRIDKKDNTNVLSKKNSHKKNNGEKFDYKTFPLPDCVDREMWNGWMEIRKAKKGAMSEFALSEHLATLLACKDAGIEPNAALVIARKREWIGIEVGWVQNAIDSTKKQHGTSGNKSTRPEYGKIYESIIDSTAIEINL